MTFKGRFRVAPDYPYAEYDENGKWRLDENGKRLMLLHLLKEIVADASRPSDERERAVEVLKFYAETVRSVAEYPRSAETSQTMIDSDNRVAEMFAQQYIYMMWYTPEDCLVRDWPQTFDYSIHPLRSVVSKRFHGPRSVTPEPTPGSVPEFEPAVPLPVRSVSDVEKQAVNELSFDERFSPGAVAARVAAIEHEAAEARRMRNQTE
jgi:hypothetical protein